MAEPTGGASRQQPVIVTKFLLFLQVAQTSLKQTSEDARENLVAAKHSVSDFSKNAPSSIYQYFATSTQFYRENKAVLRLELISGFTIAILQIPESVAFSFVAGLDPIVGLRATVFMGFICGLLSARPTMVSGAAGAIAVIIADLSGAGGSWRDRPDDEVNNLIYMTVILAGVFQMAIGAFGLARVSTLIPFTAMIGFMNGLAIIILISQLDAFKRCPGQEYSVCAKAGTLQWMPLDEGQPWMVILEVSMAAIIVVVFPKFKRFNRYVPAALVALICVSIFEHAINRTAIHLPTRTVEETAPVSGTFKAPGFPKLPSDTPWSEVITYAIIMAAVGVIESIMTSDAITELLGATRSSFASTQESLAQGLGNFISGLTGGFGGDAMIGQSTVNVLNGATGRLSCTSASVWLVIIIIALPDAIGLVPVACLTGILFIIVIKTFHWPTFILLFQLSWPDSFAIIMVTVLAVTTNLAIAIGAGVVWRALVHAFSSTQLLHVWSETSDASKPQHSPSTNLSPSTMSSKEGEDADAGADKVSVKIYHVEGPLFFGSAMGFAANFSAKTDPESIIIDFSGALVADFSAVTAIRAVCKSYVELNKRVTVTGLDAYSHKHVQRNPKLDRHIRTEMQMDYQRHRDRTNINDLELFQPHGDELHRPEAAPDASETEAMLRQDGVTVQSTNVDVDRSPSVSTYLV